MVRRAGVIAAACVIWATAAVAQTAGDPYVSALNALPQPKRLPPLYRVLLRESAIRIGISPTIAAHRTRLLLTNVTGLPLYAYAGSRNRVCFIVWRGGGTCGVLDGSHRAIWVVDGGSRRRGQAVVGVVSDGVRAVEVSLGSRTVRARVWHNAFVVPFREPRGKPAPMPGVTAITN